jgi:hypothetical protein
LLVRNNENKIKKTGIYTLLVKVNKIKIKNTCGKYKNSPFFSQKF